MLIWGTLGIFVKQIPIPAEQICLARSAIGSVVLILMLLITKHKFNWSAIRKHMPLLVVSGAIVGYNWMFLFIGYQYTSVANATLAYYFAPIIMILAASILFREKLTSVKIICIAASVIGMFCIMGDPGGEGSNNILGIASGLFAALLYATVLIINKYLKDLHPLESTFFQLFFNTIAMIPYVLLRGDLIYSSLDAKGITLLMILGVVHTGFAFIMFFGAIPRLPSENVALYAYMDPMSAIVFAWIILGESMGPVQVAGAILIIGSAAFNDIWANRRKHQDRSLSDRN